MVLHGPLPGIIPLSTLSGDDWLCSRSRTLHSPVNTACRQLRKFIVDLLFFSGDSKAQKLYLRKFLLVEAEVPRVPLESIREGPSSSVLRVLFASSCHIGPA